MNHPTKTSQTRHSAILPDEVLQAQTVGPGRRRVRRLTDFEWLAVAFALLFVHAAFFPKLIYSASYCDAAGYQNLAGRIMDHGIFSATAFGALRTYGYPLFLSALRLLARFTTIPIALLATEFQLCIYLLAVRLLRNEIRRISWRLGQWLFVAFCLTRSSCMDLSHETKFRDRCNQSWILAQLRRHFALELRPTTQFAGFQLLRPYCPIGVALQIST